MMKINAFCQYYFHAYQDLFKFQNNTLSQNASSLFILATYFSAIIPLAIAITYGLTTLMNRITVMHEFNQIDSSIQAIAQGHFNPSENPINFPDLDSNEPYQTSESICSRCYPGELTSQQKENMKASFSDDQTELLFSFTQSPHLKLKIQRKNIFESQAQVIVNAANSPLLRGGGIDGLIHKKGGHKYEANHKALRQQYIDPKKEHANYPLGYATMIKSGDLKEKYQISDVIVVAGPQGEVTTLKENQLYSCYYNSLILAHSKNVLSLAFPSISTGIFGFSKETAAAVSLRAVYDFVTKFPKTPLKQISIHFTPQEPVSVLENYDGVLSKSSNK
jgi:O-acetyl-ADP-ribose deacetylase (regulator of RNase III)